MVGKVPTRHGELRSVRTCPGQAEGSHLSCILRHADSGTRALASVLSIGDSEAEMQGNELAVLAHQACGALAHGSCLRRRSLSAPASPRLPSHPWVKNLKLWACPSVDQLIEQLNLLARV